MRVQTSGYLFTFSDFKFVLPLSAIGFHDTIVHAPHPWPLALGLGSCVLYVLLVALWPRKQQTVCGSAKNHGVLHHIALFFFSLMTFCLTFYYMILSGDIFSFTSFLCTPIPGWLRLLSLSFTVSKVWEWGDTLVMLEKGDSLHKIGFLHLYHHCTTFLLFLCTANFPGADKSGMLFNAFVHTLMYAHFAWRLPKPLRPLITGAQILQLGFVTWFWGLTPSTCPELASFPSAYPVEFWIPYALVPVYLAFFLKFFVGSYIIRSRKVPVKILDEAKKK